MNDFEQALGAYIANKMDLAQFREELGSFLFMNASVSDEIMERLEEEHRLGHLSSESHEALMTDVRNSISDNHPTILDFSMASTNDDHPTGFTAAVTETLADETSAEEEEVADHEGGDAVSQRKTRRELHSGDTLNNRFVLESAIKRGGMGTVFKALDKRRVEVDARQVYVAIKALNLELSLHPDALKALQHEAFKSQGLSHPNIVNVFDFDRDGDIAFIAMEFLEGETLASLLKRLRPDVLPKDKAMSLIRDMGAALAYSHERGLLHADFKPANVFVTKDGVAKLLDFGVARALDTQRDPGTDNDEFDPVLLGGKTPAYATREMLEGKDPDPRDDVYALACVAYQLLSGSHPYWELSGKVAKEKGLRPKRIRALKRAHWRGLARGLALDRANRAPSVVQFLADIGRRSQTSAVSIAWGTIAAAALLLLAGGLVFQRAVDEEPSALIMQTPVAEPQAAALSWLDDAEELSAATSGAQPAVPEEASAVAVPVEQAFAYEPAGDVSDSAETNDEMAVEVPELPAMMDEEQEALVAELEQEIAAAGAPGPGTIAFAASTYSVAESNAVVRLIIERRDGMEGDISLEWRTVDDTARADEDYGSFDWTPLDIEPGIAEYSLYIPIVSDLKTESDEMFRVELGRVKGGALLGSPIEATVTIVDDDAEAAESDN